MNTIPVLYYLKRNQPGVPENRKYLYCKQRAWIGTSNGKADVPTLQWGSKEEATAYAGTDADFLIIFARALFKYALEKEECK